jgi:protein involved in polysaccharide export with SLBB domain
MGRVNAPGIFPLEAPMTVIEAIARAGGLFTSRLSGTTEELADLHHSFLVRRGKHVPVNFYRLIREGDTTQNIFLQPDDFLYLPSALASEVFVIGAVRHPQRVGFNDQVTVISAIAQAGGPAEDAWLGHVAVIRGSLSSPAIAVVDYKAIVRGKQADVLLEPRDIVYVPLSPYRSLRRYADVALETFVRTVAANEGARVVDPNYIPPGVSVPLGQ